MGITLSIAVGGGIIVAFDWGAAIALGISVALGAISSRGQRNNETLHFISHQITQNLSERKELCQTIYQSKQNKNDHEPPLIDSSYSPSNYPPIFEPIIGQKEKNEAKIIEGCLAKNKLNEIEKSFKLVKKNPFMPNFIGISNNYSYKYTFFTDFESKEFENYVRNKAFPSNSISLNENKGKKIGLKVIDTLGQDHITDLLIKNVRNQHYYLNFKNKKILGPLNYEIFKEKNFDRLHPKVEGIRIFGKIIKTYNIIERTEKIAKIIIDEDKKISHKSIELAAESGKIAAEQYFVKKYFMNSLRAIKKGAKEFKKFYNSSKIIKGAKVSLKVGSIGSGIIITLLADKLIEGTCDLAAKGLEKTIDYLEDKK